MAVNIILLSMVTASIAFTLSETRAFEWMRHWLVRHCWRLAELVRCGYCLAQWIGFLMTGMFRPRLFHCWAPLDYVFTALVIAWLASWQWAAMCWLLRQAGK